MIDDYNHLEIDSKITNDDATTSDIIIFSLSKTIKRSSFWRGNDGIIEYHDIEFSSYEENKPNKQSPYDKGQILDWRKVGVKDIRFAKTDNNDSSITSGNTTKIVTNWDKGVTIV